MPSTTGLGRSLDLSATSLFQLEAEAKGNRRTAYRCDSLRIVNGRKLVEPLVQQQFVRLCVCLMWPILLATAANGQAVPEGQPNQTVSPLSAPPQFSENKSFRPSEVSQTIESASHTSGLHSEAASAMVKELDRLFRSLDESSVGLARLGLRALQQNQPGEALRRFGELSGGPSATHFVADVGHAVALFQLARYEESTIALCHLAAKPQAGDRLVPLLENLAALVPTKAELVEQALRQILTRHPESSAAQLALGQTVSAKAPAEASSLFRAAASNEKDARPLLQLAKLQQSQQRFAAAVESLRQALKRQPDLAEAHYRLALLLYQSGKKLEGDQHMAAFRKLRQ